MGEPDLTPYERVLCTSMYKVIHLLAAEHLWDSLDEEIRNHMIPDNPLAVITALLIGTRRYKQHLPSRPALYELVKARSSAEYGEHNVMPHLTRFE